MDTPEVHFAPGVDASRVSAQTLAVLVRILFSSGNPSCLVTRVTATPREEAIAIHDNCVEHGTESQRRLYSTHDGRPLPGCKVIDTFVASTHLSRAATIDAMTETIEMLGPYNVSHHCGDPAILCVLDVAPSSLVDGESFAAAVHAENRHSGAVSRFLEPPLDPAFHIEFPQVDPEVA